MIIFRKTSWPEENQFTCTECFQSFDMGKIAKFNLLDIGKCDAISTMTSAGNFFILIL